MEWRLVFRDRRKRIGLDQRDIEIQFRFPSGTLGAIEDGRLRLEQEQREELDALLDKTAAQQSSILSQEDARLAKVGVQ